MQRLGAVCFPVLRALEGLMWHRGSPRGAYPKLRCRPPPGLLYTQVVKKRDKRRVVEVNMHVVFGALEAAMDTRL